MNNLLVPAYLAAIVGSNLLLEGHPERAPFVGFALIGLVLVVRDHLHRQWEGRALAVRMGFLIAVAGALSLVIQPNVGRVALASVAAFVVAEALDATVFHLARRLPWIQRSNLSNLPSAAADSLVFILVAFGPLWPLIAVQFLTKALGGLFWSLVLAPRRRVQAS